MDLGDGDSDLISNVIGRTALRSQVEQERHTEVSRLSPVACSASWMEKEGLGHPPGVDMSSLNHSTFTTA